MLPLKNTFFSSLLQILNVQFNIALFFIPKLRRIFTIAQAYNMQEHFHRRQKTRKTLKFTNLKFKPHPKLIFAEFIQYEAIHQNDSIIN
jgi:hypothetical protein